MAKKTADKCSTRTKTPRISKMEESVAYNV